MRKAITKVGAVFGTAALVASTGLALSQATSNAEPAGHQVRYTVTSTAPTGLDLYYLFAQPADKAAYNKDPNAFLKREEVSLEPGVPWVFETTLADPQWAIVTVSGAAHAMTGAPNPHCEIFVDGQLVLQQDGETGAACQLSRW
jgi:hypothetical protein